MLTIVQAPNKVLATPAKKIGKIDKAITHLIKEMELTLQHATDPEGVGLAAPQVGKSLQIFIIKEAPTDPLQVFINPTISIPQGETVHTIEIGEEEKKEVKLEGCLSLQDIWGVVGRYEKIELEYLDETGKKHKKTFDGFLATIIQHEFDHLNGTLFPKRVLEQNGKLYKSIKNKKGEVEFQEVSL